MSVVQIQALCQLPLVTIVRLMGAVKKRLNPKSGEPGADADPDNDAAVIAELERKIKESKGKA